MDKTVKQTIANSTYAQWPMKEQLETAMSRRKLVAGDSDEARKRLLGKAANR
jgi:hypothetical protein